MPTGSAPLLPHLAANYLKRLKTQAAVGSLLTALSAISPRLRVKDVKDPGRIAIFCQWGIGDAVLLIPLLRGLRSAYPKASLELIGKPWLADLFVNEDCCDRTHILLPPWTAYSRKYRPTMAQMKSYLSEISRLRQERFDWLISPRFDPREILQLRLLRARATYGFGSAGGRHWITNDFGMTRSTHDSMHRADLAAEISRSIAVTADDGGVFFRTKATMQDWLAKHGYRDGPILAVHTGAGHPIRRWRDRHFDRVLAGLTISPGLIVFIEDSASEGMPWDGALPHVHWRGDLLDLKAILSACDVFLGTDSGVMHMAAAAGCAVVGVFGPGEPRWFAPFGEKHSIIFNEIPCRPCFDKCIHSTPICMESIEDYTIIRAVDDQLRNFSSGIGRDPSTRYQHSVGN